MYTVPIKNIKCVNSTTTHNQPWQYLYFWIKTTKTHANIFYLMYEAVTYKHCALSNLITVITCFVVQVTISLPVIVFPVDDMK